MNLKELEEYQKKIANKKVVLEDKIKIEDLKFVAGVDQAFVGNKVISACVLLKFPRLEVVKEGVEIEDVEFPYIPTFLMFREGKPAVNVVRKVLKDVDNVVLLVDGSGIAHPRKCGLATYIAIETGIPSIGITKRRLYGRVEDPKDVMEVKPIYDNSEIIGYALKPCKNCNPIYISPGSYVTPETALEIVKACLKGYKLPEPIRLAHKLANASKNRKLSDFF
ncbi:endonuclease V [Archaeoglobus profundus]|uniref:Endonuclease V n=1 Tax=Archaeoglobus profundus (strain DSM 5631 / JCM 9629 / NBRC 100127 / Av18) TaxID=572546 RepID=D2RDE4_ARCPA|nr:endonuclease V [Archaeoglobus profundus]ADB58138.1 Deoxyribonuclease V [Archaeoglobus profundus DSM 5631]